jgi:protein PhnA
MAKQYSGGRPEGTSSIRTKMGAQVDYRFVLNKKINITGWKNGSKPSAGAVIRRTTILRSQTPMPTLPDCPQCNSSYTYEDRNLYVCPVCAHEWSRESGEVSGDGRVEVRDANGNSLQDGDTVTVIKDLKVKGSSSVIKVGTKVKNISLVDGDHNIDCKVSGVGAMKLKSEFVKKVND